VGATAGGGEFAAAAFHCVRDEIFLSRECSFVRAHPRKLRPPLHSLAAAVRLPLEALSWCYGWRSPLARLSSRAKPLQGEAYRSHTQRAAPRPGAVTSGGRTTLWISLRNARFATGLHPQAGVAVSRVFAAGEIGKAELKTGGEGGIRTPDTVARMPHFECGAFNHSATSPERKSQAASRRGDVFSGGVAAKQGRVPAPRRWRQERPF
jgi:hypothetical protein